MGLRVITDKDTGQAVMYDSVTMTAFGQVWSSEDHAEHFLAWLGETQGITDARAFYPARLNRFIAQWAEQNLDADGELTDEAEHASWSPFA